MIQEDYVSFKTAKLLKEKGFNECPLFHYLDTSQLWIPGGYDKTKKWMFQAPTLQMALKWLGKVHKIIPVILTGGDTITPFYYWFRIDKINNGKWEDSVYRNETENSTYEKACESAIKYCLENMI